MNIVIIRQRVSVPMPALPDTARQASLTRLNLRSVHDSRAALLAFNGDIAGYDLPAVAHKNRGHSSPTPQYPV